MTTFLDSWVLNTLRECGLRKPELVAPRVIGIIEMAKRDERIAEATGSIEEIAAAFHLSEISVKKIRSKMHYRSAA